MKSEACHMLSGCFQTHVEAARVTVHVDMGLSRHGQLVCLGLYVLNMSVFGLSYTSYTGNNYYWHVVVTTAATIIIGQLPLFVVLFWSCYHHHCTHHAAGSVLARLCAFMLWSADTAFTTATRFSRRVL